MILSFYFVQSTETSGYYVARRRIVFSFGHGGGEQYRDIVIVHFIASCGEVRGSCGKIGVGGGNDGVLGPLVSAPKALCL